jgi:hypothetical protein
MPRCIYCTNTFATAGREHVLQNFLGARWDTPLIACNDCQDYFSHTIDLAFERGLKLIRNLLATRGGRKGEAPPLKRVSTSAGETVDIAPGWKPSLSEPEVEITRRPDGRHDVKIRMSRPEQLSWALAKLRKELPHAKVDEAMARTIMRATEGFLAGRINLELNLGGLDFFRGVVKASFNLLAAHATDGPGIALQPEFNAVRAFVRQGTGTMADFVRWATEADYAQPPLLGPIDHVMGLVSRDGLEGVVQVFGHIAIPVRLTDSATPRSVSCGYVVDPYRNAEPAETRLTSIDPVIVPHFAQESPQNNPAVQGVFKARLQRIFDHFYDKARNEIISSTVDEILKPRMGEPFTEEIAARLSSRLAEKMRPFLARPDDGD